MALLRSQSPRQLCGDWQFGSPADLHVVSKYNDRLFVSVGFTNNVLNRGPIRRFT